MGIEATDSNSSGPPWPRPSREPCLPWTAYTLGRSLNQIRWQLEQAPFFKKALPKGGVRRLLNDLVPPVRILLQDPAAARVEAAIVRRIELWGEWTTRESAGDEVSETFDRYRDRAETGRLDEDFDDATEYGRSVERSLLKAFLAALRDHRHLINLIKLGRLVDQGIHPPDALRYVFREVPIPPQTRVFRLGDGGTGYDLRLFSSLNDVTDVPREGKKLILVASVGQVLHFRMFDHGGDMVEDTDERKLTAKATQIDDLKELLRDLWPPHRLTTNEKGRILDDVTSIVGHALSTSCAVTIRTKFASGFCRLVNEPPEPEWSLKLRKLWHRAGMTVPPPEAVYSLSMSEQVPPEGSESIVASIDEKATEVFFKNEDTTGDSMLSTAQQLAGSTPADDMIVELPPAKDLEGASKAIRCPLEPSGEGALPHRGDDDGKTTGPLRRVQSKNPRISKGEAERRVGDFLRTHPDAKIGDVVKAVKVPKSSVYGTDAWQKRPKNLGFQEDRSVRAKNIGLSQLHSNEAPPIEEDPDAELDFKIVILPFFDRHAEASEKSDYQGASVTDKFPILVAFMERVKNTIYEYDQNDASMVKAFQRMIADEDFPGIQLLYEQTLDESPELIRSGCSEK